MELKVELIQSMKRADQAEAKVNEIVPASVAFMQAVLDINGVQQLLEQLVVDVGICPLWHLMVALQAQMIVVSTCTELSSGERHPYVQRWKQSLHSPGDGQI